MNNTIPPTNIKKDIISKRSRRKYLNFVLKLMIHTI